MKIAMIKPHWLHWRCCWLTIAAPAVADKADSAFMMICTALVLFMTIPGIALFYGGLIRAKNVLSMLTQVTVTFALVCILWVVYGYSLAFGEGNHFFGNADGAMLKNIALTAVTVRFISIFMSRFRIFRLHYRRADCRRAGGAYSFFGGTDFCRGVVHALLYPDCAHGVGRRPAGCSRRAGFCRWYGGAY